MKLIPIGPNQTELDTDKGQIFFSYKTPVAYHQSGVGYAKTSKHWSTTTSRHINQWLRMNGYDAERGDGLREVSQEELDNLIV